jgi:molybdenum cofactor cytidylyltransferase
MLCSEPMDLRRALRIKPREVVAIVGGGGKTTLLYGLARETVAAGGRVIVTGTTRFTPPADGQMPTVLLKEDSAELLAGLRAGLATESLIVVGTGWGNQGRIMPVAPALLAEMRDTSGVSAVVAEADGSAGRPFKAPAEHEPVVAPATSLLLTVVGLDVLGRPLSAEFVHRPEIVAGLSGAALGDAVDEQTVARVLLHEQGGRKGLPAGARWIPVLNKADTVERIEAAQRIARLLVSAGVSHVLIAHAVVDPPVVEVIG